MLDVFENILRLKPKNAVICKRERLSSIVKNILVEFRNKGETKKKTCLILWLMWNQISKINVIFL